MSQTRNYPNGTPCWIKTVQPDPRAATEFYGPLFGWKFRAIGTEMTGKEGMRFIAMLENQDVAGIEGIPATEDQTIPPMWTICVRTVDIEETIDCAAETGGSVLLDPLTEPNGDRSAMLMDPTGAAISLLQTNGKTGANRVNEPGTWMMSSLHTPNTTVAGDFYRSVFGWKAGPTAVGSNTSFLHLPGHVGHERGHGIPEDVIAVMTNIDTSRDAIPTPPHWGVNLRVADTNATTAQTIELGGRVLMPPTTTPQFINAVLVDSQGAVFSVSQLR
jgi:uncharacterized protein